MKKHLFTLFTAGILLGAVSAQGAVLLQYTFENSGGSGTAAIVTPTTTEVGFAATSVSLVGLNEDTSRNGGLGLTSAASTPTDYIAFEIAGTFDFESVIDPIGDPGVAGQLSFDTTYNNGTRTISSNYWEVYVSTDDFATSNINLGTVSVDQSQTGALPPVIDLSGKGISGAQTLDFRIYLVRSATWNDATIDNLAISAAVPEPSTYALFAGFLALGGVMLRRRFKD